MIHFLQQTADYYKVRSPWTPVYGLARSLLALGTLVTFIFNDTNVLFVSLESYLNKQDIFAHSLLHQLNLFLLFGAKVWIGKLIAIIILLLVITGWRPMITGWLHFWVAISFSTLSGTIDGGDTITSILTFLLIPVCMTDKRKSHWKHQEFETDPYITLFAWSIFFIIRLQVCIIYLHSGIDKLKVDEWTNGTCTYYWFTNTAYGAADWLRPFLFRIMSIPIIVVSITWGTVLFEIFIGMALLLRRNQVNWKVLLICGLLFHCGIIIVFGLVSFFLAMTACLLLYLMPLDYVFAKNKGVKKI